MNRKLILIFLLTIFQISWVQDCDFEIRNLANNLNGRSELIEKSEYEKIIGIAEKLIDYQPKSEHELTKIYPEIFKLKDSCYTFRANADDGIGINKGLLKACKNRNHRI